MNKSLFLEIDSTYRDTSIYPEPHTFKIPLNRVERSFKPSVLFWKGRGDIEFSIQGVPSVFKIISEIGNERPFRGQCIKHNGEETRIVSYTYDKTIYVETPFSSINPGLSCYVENTSTKSSIIVFMDITAHENMFKGHYITNMTKNETRIIHNFSSLDMRADLTLPFTNTDKQDTFCITKDKPLLVKQNFQIESENGLSCIELDTEPPREWIGHYITIMYFIGGDGDRLEEYTSKILQIDGKKIKFTQGLTNLGIDVTLHFIITKGVNQTINHFNIKPSSKIYNVRLNNLILPNIHLGLTYPYLDVEIFNKHFIYSNNVNNVKPTFRCPFNDINVLDFTSFIKLNSKMVVPLCFDTDIFFRVYLPDGKPYIQQGDSVYPNQPDPLKQISCCLEIDNFFDNETC